MTPAALRTAEPPRSRAVSWLLGAGNLLIQRRNAEGWSAGSEGTYVYKAPDVSLIAGGVMTMTLRSPEDDVYVATPFNNKEPGNPISNCDGCALQKQTIELDRRVRAV